MRCRVCQSGHMVLRAPATGLGGAWGPGAQAASQGGSAGGLDLPPGVAVRVSPGTGRAGISSNFGWAVRRRSPERLTNRWPKAGAGGRKPVFFFFQPPFFPPPPPPPPPKKKPLFFPPFFWAFGGGGFSPPPPPPPPPQSAVPHLVDQGQPHADLAGEQNLLGRGQVIV